VDLLPQEYLAEVDMRQPQIGDKQGWLRGQGVLLLAVHGAPLNECVLMCLYAHKSLLSWSEKYRAGEIICYVFVLDRWRGRLGGCNGIEVNVPLTDLM